MTQVNCLDPILVKEKKSVFKSEWLEDLRPVAATGTYVEGRVTYNYVLYMHKEQPIDQTLLQRFKTALKCSHGQYKENEEYQYIELIKRIDSEGDTRPTRGVDSQGNRLTTKSVFGV